MLIRTPLRRIPSQGITKATTLTSSTNNTHRPVLREHLHYAIDAEFHKARGEILARSIAFVPFITSSEVESKASKTNHMQGSKSQLLLRTSNGPLRSNGAAAQALLDAKLKKERASSTIDSAPLSSSDASPASQTVTLKIAPSEFTPKTIVVAMRSSAALGDADVLPCGHVIDHLCRAHLPISYYNAYLPYGGRFGGGVSMEDKEGDATLKRFLGKSANKVAIPAAPPAPTAEDQAETKEEIETKDEVEAEDEVTPTLSDPIDVSDAPAAAALTVVELAEGQKALKAHYSILRSRLDPYNIPNIAKHEALLRKLFNSAVKYEESKTQQGKVADPYGPVLDEDGGTMIFRSGGEELAVPQEHHYEDVARDVLDLLLPLLTSRRKGNPNKGRCFAHDLKYYGPPFLLNYFKGEDDFINFLYSCHDEVQKAMAALESRYTSEVSLKVPWSLILSDPPCEGLEGQSQDNLSECNSKAVALPSDRALLWGKTSDDKQMPHEYILCDTFEEFAVATSAVWQRLLTLDSALRHSLDQQREATKSSKESETQIPAIKRRAIPSLSLSSLTMARIENAFFYSYGGADADTIRSTVALVRDLPSTQVEEIIKRMNLTDKLNQIYSSESATADPPSSLLLPSPYLVAVRDITSHSLFFASGIPYSGRKVPKLVDALHIISPKSPEARHILVSSETDNHNPLWDAAALGAVCSFVLKMKR